MFEAGTVTTYLLGFLLVLVIYLYWYFTNTYKYWEKRNIPYLKPTIPFGNFLNVYTRTWTLGEAFGEFYLKFKRMGLKHGGMFVLNKPVYIPVDPDIIKRIIISDADNFPNHGLYINVQDDPLSAHIFNMEGNRWKDIRTKFPQAFTSAKMRKMFFMIVNIAEEFQQRLEGCIEKYPEGIDIKNELARYTTDVISTCGFGLQSDTLKDKNLELIQHLRLFFDYQWNLYKNSMVLAFSRNLLKMFNFQIFRKDTTQYVRKMFNDLKATRKEGDIQRDDLANTILRLTERNEANKEYKGEQIMEPLDENEYIAQMWIFMCASFETSSSVQTFALYEMSKNPETQTKLRNEINTVLARHGNNITYDAVMEMKYLESVIDETLRLYPVFPIMPRVCKDNYKVPGTDFVLEKDTLVLVTNYGLQRDPEYYPEPLKFEPDRFSSENKGERPFIAHMPFGEGPRICVGKRFGLLQTKVGLIKIIKNYEVSLSAKTKEGFKFDPWHLILSKQGGTWIHLKKIEQQ